MSTKPRVSVVIPSYNHAHYVPDAIQSVIDQSFKDFEIIVVDDGSTDNTREAVSQFGKQVIYIRQENRGLSGARNTGILASRGEFIALLDSDDLYEPDFLKVLVGVLDKNDDADAVYCFAKTIDRENNELPQQIGIVVEPSQLYDRLLLGGFFPPSCLMARRYCYMENSHLFDESLRRVEDIDLWLKFATKYTVIGIAQPLLRYRIDSQSLSTNPELVLQHRIAVIQRHFGRNDEKRKTSKVQINEAIGRSHLGAAIEYLQFHDIEQTYNHLLLAFNECPELVNDPEIFYVIGLGSQPRGYRTDLSTVDLDKNSEILLGLIDKVFSDSRNGRFLQSKQSVAYGNAYLSLGMLYYNSRQFRKARQYLLQAVMANPQVLQSLDVNLRFLKTLLPVWLVDRMRIFRTRLVPL